MATKSVQRVPLEIPLFGLVVPGVCLAALYVGAEAVGLVFGNVIFALTILVSGVWILVAGWGRQMRAASPLNEYLFRSGSRFATDDNSDAVESRASLQTRVLVVLTGIVLWGWLLLLVELAVTT